MLLVFLQHAAAFHFLSIRSARLVGVDGWGCNYASHLCSSGLRLVNRGLRATAEDPNSAPWHSPKPNLFRSGVENSDKSNNSPYSGVQADRLSAVLPVEIFGFQKALAEVRQLQRVENNESLIVFNDRNNLHRICRPGKPTYRRLFTHQTWELHLGGSTLTRWVKIVKGIPFSVIVHTTWKSVVLITMYAFVVSHLLPVSIISTLSQSHLPFNFCGSAIGLLLVFRTNHAYSRLDEARALWGRLCQVTHEIASLVAASEGTAIEDAGGLLSGSALNTRNSKRWLTTRDVVAVHRYLVAFAWALRDELRDNDPRDDILRLLITDAREEQWIAASRSRSMALMNRLRRKVHDMWKRDQLADHTIFLLEGQVLLFFFSHGSR